MTLTFPSPARLALIAALAGSCSLSALAQAQPQTPLRTGEAVYQSICIACHATGVAHAPKLGDSQAWKPLIEEGCTF